MTAAMLATDPARIAIAFGVLAVVSSLLILFLRDERRLARRRMAERAAHAAIMAALWDIAHAVLDAVGQDDMPAVWPELRRRVEALRRAIQAYDEVDR